MINILPVAKEWICLASSINGIGQYAKVTEITYYYFTVTEYIETVNKYLKINF